MDKIQTIKSLESLELRSQDSLMYALYSSLTKNELSNYIKKYYKNVEFRDNLIKHISKKFDDHESAVLIDYFLDIYSQMNVREKRSIGKLFTILLEKFTTKQHFRLVDLCIGSEYISIRKKAYEHSCKIYNRTISNRLLYNLEQYGDIEIYDVFIVCEDYKILYDRFDDIWSSEKIQIKKKNRIVNLIAKYDHSFLDVIKKKNLVSYISASYHAKDLNFLDDIEMILDHTNSLYQLNYCIWILGQLCEYEKIVEIIPLIKRIESTLPKTFDEQMEEYYA